MPALLQRMRDLPRTPATSRPGEQARVEEMARTADVDHTPNRVLRTFVERYARD